MKINQELELDHSTIDHLSKVHEDEKYDLRYIQPNENRLIASIIEEIEFMNQAGKSPVWKP